MAEDDKGGGGEDRGGGGTGDAGGGAPPAPTKMRDPQTLLVLANTLLVIVALGVLVYTKLLFERPPIVEEKELVKAQEAAKGPVEPAEKLIVPFDQLMVNIAMT